jgi:hypothetical protein
MAADQCVPILHARDVFHLRKVRRDILGEGKPPPRHPAWKDDIYDHQDSLRRGKNKNVARFVGVAVIAQFERLIARV